MNPRHELGLRLHHVGVLVPDIAKRKGFFLDILHYEERTPLIHDPVQTAYVQFFVIPGSDHYLELVAPDSESSKLQLAARKGLPLNHVCYSCANIGDTVAHLRESGCFVISDPVPAVAFDGRPIAWLMAPGRLLMELVEKGPEGSL